MKEYERFERIGTTQKQLKTLSGIMDETMELAASSTGDGKRFQEEMKSLSSQMVVLEKQYTRHIIWLQSP